MKRTILICGLIGGLISVGWFVVSEQLLSNHMSIETRTYFGYATMIVGLSVIFVAIKNYRDNYNRRRHHVWQSAKDRAPDHLNCFHGLCCGMDDRF